jgi:large subunit ribosomal protein L9
MIEVILLERVERLGQMGQTVKVKPGFARNFLLPQNKALRATKANLEQFEKQRAVLEAKNASDRAAAEALGAKLDGMKFVIIRQASEAGQLYGSVASRDIADATKDAKQPIERNKILIDLPIKTLGLFAVKVRLHAEVMIKITINIARSQEEAKVQAEKGAAVIKAAAQADADAAVIAALPAAESDVKPAKKAKAEKADAAADEAPKAKKPRAKKSAEA